MRSRRSVEQSRSRGRGSRSTALSVALGFLVLCGVGMWLAGPQQKDFLEAQETYRKERDGGSALPPEEAERVQRVAQQYAYALREGDCDTAIGLTYWMQERLARIAADSGQAAARRVHQELCAELLDVEPTDRQLRDEGIEDSAVFRAPAEFRPLRTDAGEDNLAAPVAGRLWIEVTYPGMESAIRDPDGRPIRQIRVGVTVSTDGLVLKTGVLGNVELDYDSVIPFY